MPLDSLARCISTPRILSRLLLLPQFSLVTYVNSAFGGRVRDYFPFGLTVLLALKRVPDRIREVVTMVSQPLLTFHRGPAYDSLDTSASPG